MSQNVNEPIDPQSPIDATAKGGDAGAPGILFPLGNYTQTGATVAKITGTASGVYVSSEHYNRGARGVRLYAVIAPTGAATGTVNLQVQVPDPVSGVWVTLGGTLGTGAFAVNGTGALTGALFTIYPMGFGGAAATGDSSGASGASGGTIVSQQLGPRWRVQATVANDTVPFSVGADYLL